MLPLVSQAWNSWKNAKGVALLAILALAVGIGSATAIYTVAHTVLLKPLPYRDGNRIVALYGATNNEPGKRNGMSEAYLRSFAQRQRSFDVFGWFTVREVSISALPVSRCTSTASASRPNWSTV